MQNGARRLLGEGGQVVCPLFSIPQRRSLGKSAGEVISAKSAQNKGQITMPVLLAGGIQGGANRFKSQIGTFVPGVATVFEG